MSNANSPAATALPLATILRLDAITCLLMGALLLAAAGPVAALTALPQVLLFWAGVALFPVAAFMWLTASGRLPGRWPVMVVVLGNLGWVTASLAVALMLSPNALGVVFLLGQAAAVLGFAVLEGQRSRESSDRLA